MIPLPNPILIKATLGVYTNFVHSNSTPIPSQLQSTSTSSPFQLYSYPNPTPCQLQYKSNPIQLHFNYIPISFQFHPNTIPIQPQIYSNFIPIPSQLHSNSNPTPFQSHPNSSPTSFQIHSNSIPLPFQLLSDSNPISSQFHYPFQMMQNVRMEQESMKEDKEPRTKTKASIINEETTTCDIGSSEELIGYKPVIIKDDNMPDHILSTLHFLGHEYSHLLPGNTRSLKSYSYGKDMKHAFSKASPLLSAGNRRLKKSYLDVMGREIKTELQKTLPIIQSI